VAARASGDALAQRIDDLRDEMRAGFADTRASFAEVRADIRVLHTRVDRLLLTLVVGLFGVVATLLVTL
jgi:hypothetical protein